jgi:hypothetical protein
MSSKVVKIEQMDVRPELGANKPEVSIYEFQQIVANSMRDLFAKHRILSNQCKEALKRCNEMDNVIYTMNNRLNHLAEAVCQNG